MKQIATKTDTVDTLPANAFNSLSSENQNAVTKSGQTLDATSETTPDPNPTQLARAITKAAQEARAYSDSGAANAYVLTATGSWQQPTAYTNGMTVEFIGANANTGASTVNVAGLGVKNITTVTGAVINSDSIGPDKISRIRFDSSGDQFLLEPVGASSGGSGTGAFNYIANPDAETDATTGITSQATTGSWTIAKTILASELPEPTSKSTAFKISGSTLTVNDYVEFQAVGTINDADGGRIGSGQIKVKNISGSILGQYKFQAYNKTTSEYIGDSRTVTNEDSTYDFDVPIISENDIVIHMIALTASPSNIGVSGVGLFAESKSLASSTTNPQSYTPSNTQGFGAITGANLEYWLDGGNLEIQGYFTTGTVVASEMQLELPPGFTIRGGGSPSIAGPMNRDAAVSNGLNYYVLYTNGDTHLNFGQASSGASTNPLSPGLGTLLGSSERISLRASIPVNEGIKTLTGIEAVYQNAKGSFESNAGQAIADSTWTSLNFEDAVQDELQGQWDGTTFTANRTGFLQAEGNVLWANAFSNQSSFRVFVNGTTAKKATTVDSTGTAGSLPFGFKDLYLEAGDTVVFQAFHAEGVSRNRSTDALYNWIDINWTADRSAQLPGFPTTEKANTIKQALVPITSESGEGDLGTITNWASPGTKKYKWVRLGNEVRFYWYVTSTGGSASTSTSSLLFDLPAGTPSPANHISNDASGEFPVPCSGAASSNNFVKNEVENNASTYRVVASFSTNTAVTSWSGVAYWTILPTS